MPGGFWSKVISYSNGSPEDEDPSPTSLAFQQSSSIAYHNQPPVHPAHNYGPSCHPPNGSNNFMPLANPIYHEIPTYGEAFPRATNRVEFEYEGPAAGVPQHGGGSHSKYSFDNQSGAMARQMEQHSYGSENTLEELPFDIHSKATGINPANGGWPSDSHQLDCNRNYWNPTSSQGQDCLDTKSFYQFPPSPSQFESEPRRNLAEEPLNLSALSGVELAHHPYLGNEMGPPANYSPYHQQCSSKADLGSFGVKHNGPYEEAPLKMNYFPYGEPIPQSTKSVPLLNPPPRDLGEKSRQYLLRRERNNIAVRKSREKAKRSFEDLIKREKVLLEDNARLEMRIDKMARVVSKLRGYYKSIKDAGVI